MVLGLGRSEEGRKMPDWKIIEGDCRDVLRSLPARRLVALQHGRDFIGIELNPEYAAMARERIETAVRLGFRSPQNGEAQIPGQLDIFDVA